MERLTRLRSEALEACRSSVKQRVSTALVALLPNAPPPLHAVAARACYSRLTKWTNDHWSTTGKLFYSVTGIDGVGHIVVQRVTFLGRVGP